MAELPRVFIGSSSESLDLVDEIQSQLDGAAIADRWKGLIEPGYYTLEALTELVQDYDLGIFVFAADDTADIRGKRYLVARDNVLFEAGLFIQRLGRTRTLLMVEEAAPSPHPLHLPSDLQGLTTVPFRKKAISQACSTIRKAIKKQGTRDPSNALSGGMVFLLRHLEDRGYSLRELTNVLVYFQGKDRYVDLPDTEKASWGKAAQYACQCLRALQLVDQFGSDEYGITKMGVKLLASDRLRHRFGDVLKMAKAPLVFLRV